MLLAISIHIYRYVEGRLKPRARISFRAFHTSILQLRQPSSLRLQADVTGCYRYNTHLRTAIRPDMRSNSTSFEPLSGITLNIWDPHSIVPSKVMTSGNASDALDCRYQVVLGRGDKPTLEYQACVWRLCSPRPSSKQIKQLGAPLNNCLHIPHTQEPAIGMHVSMVSLK